MDAQNFGKRACRRPLLLLCRHYPCFAAKQDEVAQRFYCRVDRKRVVVSDADLAFPPWLQVIDQFSTDWASCKSIGSRCARAVPPKVKRAVHRLYRRSRAREVLPSALSLALRLNGYCELTVRHGDAAAFNYRAYGSPMFERDSRIQHAGLYECVR